MYNVIKIVFETSCIETERNTSYVKKNQVLQWMAVWRTNIARLLTKNANGNSLHTGTSIRGVDSRKHSTYSLNTLQKISVIRCVNIFQALYRNTSRCIKTINGVTLPFSVTEISRLITLSIC